MSHLFPPFDLEYFPNFPPISGLRYVIATRHGGVSDGGFATLNLGYHVGDDPVRVTENRRRLGIAAGYDPATLVATQQVHGAAITRVTSAERGRGACDWETALAETDGLLTAADGVPVAIIVADCAPVLIVAPERHLLAVVHAGWRGAVGSIAGRAVRRMVAEDSADPASMLAGIGPTLCPACMEIGEEVAAIASHAFGPQVVRRETPTPHLDLGAIITADLTNAGLAATSIFPHPACPRCRTDRFFSHRGQQGHAGRFALVAWWEA